MEMKTVGTVFYGETCGKTTVATYQYAMTLSEERKKLILEELDENCDFDPKNRVCETTTAAIYDESVAEFKYHGDFDDRLINGTYQLEDAVRGMLYPNVQVDRFDVHNEPNKYKFVAKQPIEADSWTYWITKPSENIIVTKVWSPYILQRLVPLWAMEPEE